MKHYQIEKTGRGSFPAPGTGSVIRFAVDSEHRATNNDGMVIPGRVHKGVVVLEGGSALPEGAAVTVTFPAAAAAMPGAGKRRIQVPLVRTGEAGSVNLSGARIAEILDHEDASPRR